MGVNANVPEPHGGTPTDSPWKDSELARTINGTSISAKLDESAYFTYSDVHGECEQCLAVALKSGGSLPIGITRLDGQGAAESSYVDTWKPAGSGSVLSMLPRVNLNSLPDPNGRRIYEGGGTGTLSFDQNNVPQAQLARTAFRGTTYFTTYDQESGVYFEYFAGSSLSSSDARYGRVGRRYDIKGNTITYNYANNPQGRALLRSLSGDITGNILPYFFYADENIDSTRYAPVTKIALIDLATPANTRTVYYEYANYVGNAGGTFPYLSKVINPNKCVQLFDPIIPFAEPANNYQIKHDVDSDGYQTYFTYDGTKLIRSTEPEGRIVYYDYLAGGQTRQTALGRAPRTMLYTSNSFGAHLPMVTLDTDPLGNATYFGYDTTLARMTKAVRPNGSTTYFSYVATGANAYAMSRMISGFNGAETYFGYTPGVYDLVKLVEPRHTSSFKVTTYYTYDVARNKTSMIDPLGNTTLWGPDSLGRTVKQQDARSNATYFNYSQSTGSLDSTIDALGNVAYFGYNSFLNRTIDVSPRWKESSFQAFSTYYEYDTLNRRTKIVDAQGNVTYFDYDNRGNLLDTVDALGTVSASTYNGLRLRTQSTVTSKAGVLLSKTQDGYDIYKNRVQALDGRGNATYFFYDQIDRLTVQKDALQNSTYFTYDSVGNQTIQTDARNSSTYHFYDQLSRETAMRDALANSTYYSYDIANNRTAGVDPRGNVTYFFYDAMNRTQATRDALANPAYFFYDPVGKKSVTLNARFAASYFGYDQLNRQSRVQDALANTTYYVYDARGNQVRVIDARSNAATMAFDTLDRLSVQADALLSASYFVYDQVWNRIRSTDARKFTTYYFYDGLRRQTAVKDSQAQATYFFYDLADNQTVIIDARWKATYFGYDQVNRRSRMQDAMANSTYYVYDPVGNPVRAIDARANARTMAFDALNRMTVSANALSNATYYFYDGVGNETRVQNPRLFQSYFRYDALNRNTTILDGLGNVVYYVYDSVGNRVRTIDPRANASTVAYDLLNRATAMADALGNSGYFFYDQVGNRTRLQNGRLFQTYFGYDALNRNTAVLDAQGGSTYFFYDQVNNRVAVQDPLLHTTYYGYDGIGRRKRVLEATGARTYFTYDQVGNLIQAIDPDFHQTLYQYDSVNRLSALRFADAGSCYYFYDQTSNRTMDLDQRGNTTYYGYDVVNRPLRIQDALGRSTYFEYDASGNRTKLIDSEGASIAMTYDGINRMTAATYAVAGSVVSSGLANSYFVYDLASNPTAMGDLWGLHRMGYDPINRLSQHQFPNGNVVYFRYDQNSNVTARVYPGSAGTSGGAYDALDRQIQIQAPSGATAYFIYDAASNLTQRLLGNSMGLVASYDVAERVQSWRYSKSSGSPLTYFDYTRDQKGLITKSIREATHTVYYRYDQDDRLTAEIWRGATPETYSFRYAYDLAGNRTKARIGTTNTYYQYDQANQLTRKGTNALFTSATYFTYDKSGALTDLIEPTGTTKFAYNASGLVSQIRWRDASSAYFFYDGALQRYAIRRNGTLNYFLWDSLDLLQEQNADGMVKEEYTQARSSVPGIGQLVEVNRPGATPQKVYPVMDPRGTITKYVQSDGTTVVASREYDSFGNIIPNSSSGTWPGIFSYQGQAWQEILSNDGSQRFLLSPTRLYDPVDGHFLSRDPNRFTDPRKSPLQVAPFYQYGKQNPVVAVDPNGREFWWQIAQHTLDAMGNVVSNPNAVPPSNWGGWGPTQNYTWGGGQSTTCNWSPWWGCDLNAYIQGWQTILPGTLPPFLGAGAGGLGGLGGIGSIIGGIIGIVPPGGGCDYYMRKPKCCVDRFQVPKDPEFYIREHDTEPVSWSVKVSFEMEADFDAKKQDCSCSCCSYRQSVKGFFKLNGKVEDHLLAVDKDGKPINMNTTTFIEDALHLGENKFSHYGHRDEKGDHDSYSEDGCKYRGKDAPGYGGMVATDTYEVDLSFLATIIDTCNNEEVKDKRNWSVKFSGKGPDAKDGDGKPPKKYGF